MRFSLLLAACVAAVSLAAHPAAAQQRSTGVVVIDVKHVFENHARFKQAMDLMKRDVEVFEGLVREKQTGLRDKAEQSKQFNAGSPEYKRLEEEVAKLTSDLQVEMALKRKEFLEREAKLYFDTYNEIYDRVARFADENGIALVLRFNSESINADDRGSVLQGVNRAVVYQRNLDITLAILEQCNREAAPAARPAASATRPAGGPPTAGRPAAPGAPQRR